MPQIFKDKRFTVLFFAILFLIVGGFCFNNYLDNNVFAAGEDWLTGWTYRNQITISADCGSGDGVTCTQTIDGSYAVNKYILSGSLTSSTTWTVPPGVTSVDYLVVGGGGGGGREATTAGGGGGAGGLLTSTGFAVTPGSSVTVTVGAGGVDNGLAGTNGGDSVFSTIIATGGGAGNYYSGVAGGSGGGSGPGGSSGGTGTQNNNPAGTGFGHDGGLGAYKGGGGGGGAGTAGVNASSQVGGSGGTGLLSSITGTSTYYAGGGGGSGYSTAGSGGSGIGGDGKVSSNGGNGVANTGSGGGGSRVGYLAGSGGSGIVIIRYLIPALNLVLTDYQVKIDTSSSLYNESGLVSSWHMNEASGTFVGDTSGNSISGTATGTTIVAGKFGNARSFGGSSKVQTATPLITGTGDFSLEAWVYPTVSGGVDYIAGNYGYGNTTGIEFYKNTANNTLYAYVGNQYIAGTIALNLNAWNHVVLTRTSGAGVLYVNGVAGGTGTISSSIGSGLNFTIGNGPDYTSEVFDGNIDEVRVYSRALSASEISTHYGAIKTRLDYGDVRFTSSDGATNLSYWMEKDGTFWVKVPSLVVGANTIYMYYGNSSATSTSSGDDTFVFFDDFTGTTINTSKWVKTDSGGYISQNGVLTISDGPAAWGATEMHTVGNFNRSDGLVVQGRYKSTMVNGATYKDTTMLWTKDSGSGTDYGNFIYGLYLYEYSGTNYLAMYQDGSSGGSASGTFTANTQYNIRQIIKGTGALTQISTNGGSSWANAYNSTYSTETPFKVGFVHYQGGNVIIDDVIVRKYTASEPTVTFGGESVTGCPATGGTITKVSGYCIHTFTSSGTFIPPDTVTSVDYLVVGGGGSGASNLNDGNATGGGGGGGFLTGTGYAVTPGNSYSISVGGGGVAPAPGSNNGNKGGDSSFGTSLIAYGGGYGGYAQVGGAGGSGGGSGIGSGGGAPVSGQGSYGGVLTGSYTGGGGGGAGEAGNTDGNAAGGDGLASNITGTSVIYAGGGGGGDYYFATGGSGGDGGGGSGGNGTPAATAGTAGTNGLGGGGGGAGSRPGYGALAGGAGGSGVVIIRYLSDTTAPTIAQVTAVPSPTSDTTPNYTFSSTEAGTITYGGDCSSSTTSAVVGNNTITFNALALGTHSNCTIKVADASYNNSNTLTVNSFTVSQYISTVYSSDNLSCYVSSDCGTGVTIFKLYNYNGDHAELSSQSNYPYRVCCAGTGISNSCSGNYDTVLKLSGTTNAHVEKKTLSNYSNNACLSSSSGTVTCSYATSCSSLGADYVCLASISGDTNDHVGECTTYSNKVCCKAASIVIDTCTAKVVSDKAVSLKDTNIQLCSGADINNSSDPCYSTCWKGTGTPVVTNSNWKCGVCHDSSNNPVSCSTASSTTFSWVMPTGYVSPTNYTLVSGTLTSANPIVKFVAQDSNRQLTLNINSFGTNCSGQNSKQLLPTWKEISPF